MFCDSFLKRRLSSTNHRLCIVLEKQAVISKSFEITACRIILNYFIIFQILTDYLKITFFTFIILTQVFNTLSCLIFP